MSNVIFSKLCRDALKEMADWEKKMREITEYESTTTDSANKIERSNTGDQYTYADVCQKYESTYIYYEYEQENVVDANGVVTVDANGDPVT